MAEKTVDRISGKDLLEALKFYFQRLQGEINFKEIKKAVSSDEKKEISERATEWEKVKSLETRHAGSSTSRIALEA